MNRKIALAVNLFLVFSLLLFTVGCGGSSSKKGISLNKSELTMKIGESFNLVSTVNLDEGADKTVKYTSNNSKVAEVDENGTVKAIDSGEAVITAAVSEGGLTANLTVTVAKPVTVKVTFGLEELGGATVIDDFQKQNPSIKVSIEGMGAHDPKLMAMIAAGNAPDIIRVSAFSELPPFIARGMALPLDSYIEKSKVIKMDDLAAVNDLYRFDGTKRGTGKIYGIVKDWSFDNQMWINKKLFNDAGIAIPTSDKPMTYTEFADAAKKMTKKVNGKIEVMGASGFGVNADTFELMLAQSGKSIWKEDFSGTYFNTDDTKKVMQFWIDLQKYGAINSPLNPAADGWGGGAFVEGKIGMLMAGYWASGVMRGNDKIKDQLDNFMLVPAPVVEGGIRMEVCSAGVGAFIFKNSKYPDEAYKLWEYILAGPPSDARAKSGWGLPAFKSKFSLLPNATEFDKQAINSANSEMKYSSTAPKFNPYVTAVGMGGIMDKYYVPVLSDKMTLDEACKHIDEEIVNLINEGKDMFNAD